MIFDEKVNQGVSEKKKICQSHIAFILQKYIEEYKNSRICEFVSKREALLVLSGFIVVKIFKSIHCCKKVSFLVKCCSYN